MYPQLMCRNKVRLQEERLRAEASGRLIVLDESVTNLIVKRLAVILHDREADAVSTPPERSDRDSAPSGKLDAVNSQLQSVRKVRSSERARAKVGLAGGTT